MSDLKEAISNLVKCVLYLIGIIVTVVLISGAFIVAIALQLAPYIAAVLACIWLWNHL